MDPRAIKLVESVVSEFQAECRKTVAEFSNIMPVEAVPKVTQKINDSQKNMLIGYVNIS
jgi:hypothetical protein